jgi:hypothetical protein
LGEWLEDAEVEALAEVTLNRFLSHQLGPDDEPLPDAGMLGDHLGALIAQQRRQEFLSDSRGQSGCVQDEVG